MPPRPPPSEQPLALYDHPSDGPLGIPVECKARRDVDGGNDQQLELELHSEVDEVQNKSDRGRRAKQDVGAETAENDETQ